MSKSDELELFKKTYSNYRSVIEKDIKEYIKNVRAYVSKDDNASTELETNAFLDMLGRGGKRSRATLVFVGYYMVSGEDPTKVKAVVESGRVVEMLQAHLLILDDIFDKSDYRRGQPSAHKKISSKLRKRKVGRDFEHVGESIAINSALSGLETALMIIANLPEVEAETRLKLLNMVNRTMRITNQGQSYEMLNDLSPEVNGADIDRVIDMKTVNYTVLNPLHMGMVLAGADCTSTDAINDYALNVGRIYQLMNDVEGLFGDTKDTGKNPKDDITEGKKTHLMSYALEHARSPHKNFLSKKLGSQDVSDEDLKTVRLILLSSGALDYVIEKARRHQALAIKSLDNEAWRWGTDSVSLLKGLVESIFVDEDKIKNRLN
jgi:geranylgeranyl diphosphate synthase, type I